MAVHFLPSERKFGLLSPRSFAAWASTAITNIGYIASVNIERVMKSSSGGPCFPNHGEVHFTAKGNALAAQSIYQFMVAKDLLN